jgi:hypothetical protein
MKLESIAARELGQGDRKCESQTVSKGAYCGGPMAIRTVILALREPAPDSEVLFGLVWNEMWPVWSVVA